MAPTDVRESLICLLDVFCFWLWALFLPDMAADLFSGSPRIFRRRSKLSFERRSVEWGSCKPGGRVLDRPLGEEIWPPDGTMRRCSDVSGGQRLDPRGSCCDRQPYCCSFTDCRGRRHCRPLDYARLGCLP